MSISHFHIKCEIEMKRGIAKTSSDTKNLPVAMDWMFSSVLSHLGIVSPKNIAKPTMNMFLDEDRSMFFKLKKPTSLIMPVC